MMTLHTSSRPTTSPMIVPAVGTRSLVWVRARFTYGPRTRRRRRNRNTAPANASVSSVMTTLFATPHE